MIIWAFLFIAGVSKKIGINKADCETFIKFMNARYTIYFFVLEQKFFIFAIGTICFEVQKPNASCRASVNSVLV